MDSDTLARIRAAIEADEAAEAAMSQAPWVTERSTYWECIEIGAADGEIVTPDGGRLGNAAGIARARNRWALYLGLARAVGDMVQALDTDNEPHAGFTHERLKAALAALAEGEASDGQ